MKSDLWLERPEIWPQNPEITLPLSKSISNRVLILEALSKGLVRTAAYSKANDTTLLQRILKDNSGTTWDAEDAGTAYRFLTAYAATGNKPVVIKGTQRMQERPIAPLAVVLSQLGAKIEYQNRIGFPPLKVYPPANGLKSLNTIQFQDTKSSQFISALMLIAPLVKNGIGIRFPSPFPSFGYIRMTAEIMRKAGLKVDLNESEVFVPEQSFQTKEIEVEADWSSASYFYSFFALGAWERLVLKNLSLGSNQPDSICSEYFKALGVASVQKGENIILTKSENSKMQKMELDFSNCPDIAMTLITSFALRARNLKVRGIQNLIYKESNRIEILQRELFKIGCTLKKQDESWYLNSENLQLPERIEIDPEGDHRMAMAFSPLALFSSLKMKNPEVVEKSFPQFWDELSSLKLRTGHDFHKGN